MRQKFCIARDPKKKALIIQEYAVIDGGASSREGGGAPDERFSLLCEQAYSAEAVQSVIPKGRDALVSLLRNRNFFPIGVYMDKIAETVSGLFGDAGGSRSTDLVFDDADQLSGASATPAVDPNAPALGEGGPANVEELFEDEAADEQTFDEEHGDEDSPEDVEEE
ncbi:MAG: hypothetical protein ACM3KE_09090 [Hyphomicrobiales bacterium]